MALVAAVFAAFNAGPAYAAGQKETSTLVEIGRASCRERV